MPSFLISGFAVSLPIKVYLPIVDAFIKEMSRAYKVDCTIPARLISYLLGLRDFYKVVAIDKKQLTEFQSFNLRGELNKDGKKKQSNVDYSKSRFAN